MKKHILYSILITLLFSPVYCLGEASNNNVSIRLEKAPIISAGTISSGLSSFNCDEKCSAVVSSVSPGTIVNISARPSPGFEFAGWSGAFCGGLSPDCSFSPTSSGTIAAVFQPINPVRLTVALKAPAGTQTGAAIRIPGSNMVCSQSVSAECEIDLPRGFKGQLIFSDNDPLIHFASYNGITCDKVENLGDGIACDFTLGSPLNVTGNLIAATLVMVHGISDGQGSVTGSVPLFLGEPTSYLSGFAQTASLGGFQNGIFGVSGGSPASTYWNPGVFRAFVKVPAESTLVLTPTAASGSEFQGWSFYACQGISCGNPGDAAVTKFNFVAKANKIYHFMPKFKSTTFCNYSRTFAFNGSALYSTENLNMCAARLIKVVAPANCLSVRASRTIADAYGAVSLTNPTVNVVNGVETKIYYFKGFPLSMFPLSNQYWPVGRTHARAVGMSAVRFQTINLNFGQSNTTCNATVTIQ